MYGIQEVENHGQIIQMSIDNGSGHVVDHNILFRVERLLLLSFSRYLDVLNDLYVAMGSIQMISQAFSKKVAVN